MDFVEPNTKDKSVQASLGLSPSERRWQEEYVERCNFLKSALHEEHQTVLGCEAELRRLREQVRRLEAARTQNVVPSRVAIATGHGRSFHQPECSAIRNSTGVRVYAKCHLCFRDANDG